MHSPHSSGRAGPLSVPESARCRNSTVKRIATKSSRNPPRNGLSYPAIPVSLALIPHRHKTRLPDIQSPALDACPQFRKPPDPAFQNHAADAGLSSPRRLHSRSLLGAQGIAERWEKLLENAPVSKSICIRRSPCTSSTTGFWLSKKRLGSSFGPDAAFSGGWMRTVPSREIPTRSSARIAGSPRKPRRCSRKGARYIAASANTTKTTLRYASIKEDPGCSGAGTLQFAAKCEKMLVLGQLPRRIEVSTRQCETDQQQPDLPYGDHHS